ARSLRLCDAGSKVVKHVDDNAHATSFGYDLADRQGTVQDAKGSRLTRTFDRDSLVIRVQEDEVRTDNGLSETFYTENFFDSEHRLVTEVSQLGSAHRWLYDSRNNTVGASDGMAGPSGVSLGALRSGVPAATA